MHLVLYFDVLFINPSLYQVSQEVDHGQRHKLAAVSSIASVGGFGEPKHDSSHIRHPSSIDLSHISRVQGETGSPSYTSPVTITPKMELPISVQKGPQGPISNQMAPPSSASSHMRSDTGRSVDMVHLLTVCNLFVLICLVIQSLEVLTVSLSAEISYYLARSSGT